MWYEKLTACLKAASAREEDKECRRQFPVSLTCLENTECYLPFLITLALTRAQVL